LRVCHWGWLDRGQLGIDHWIDESRDTFWFALEIDLHHGGIERIEARFDGLTDQVRGCFVEAILQLKGAIAAHQAIQTVKEEAAEVGGRRQLADVLDVALPTQQRRGPQGAVLGAVINVEPRPQTLVQLFQSERLFAIQIVQELVPTRAEEPLDLAAAFGLIGRSVHDQHADGGRNPRQLCTAIDLGVVHIEPDSGAPTGDRLAQAVQAGVQTLGGVELGMRDEPAGVVEDGMQQGLHLAAAGALHIGAIEHIRLPDLIAMFGLELLVGLRSEQLTFRKAALFEEAVESRRGDARLVLSRRQGQLA